MSCILLIDDEPCFRMVIAAFLEDCGYHILEADNGSTGLALFETKKPDLVLTDLRLPGLDGIELSSRIRALCPNIPIIVLSGIADTSAMEKLKSIGITGYFVKPIEDLRELNKSIEIALAEKS